MAKLVPKLIAQEYCQKNPEEICQLKFSSSSPSEQPSLQPVVQRYCLQQPHQSQPEPRKIDVEPPRVQNIESQHLTEGRETTTEAESDQTTTSTPILADTESEFDLEKTTTLTTFETTEQTTIFYQENTDVTTQDVTTATPGEEETTVNFSQEKQARRFEEDQPRRNNIALKDVLKNYDDFKNEIVSQNGKKEGVLKPVDQTILEEISTQEPPTTTQQPPTTTQEPPTTRQQSQTTTQEPPTTLPPVTMRGQYYKYVNRKHNIFAIHKIILTTRQPRETDSPSRNLTHSQ